jgi:hypothetical protein
MLQDGSFTTSMTRKVYVNENHFQLNEQLLADLGISIFIGQSDDAGDRVDETSMYDRIFSRVQGCQQTTMVKLCRR